MIELKYLSKTFQKVELVFLLCKIKSCSASNAIHSERYPFFNYIINAHYSWIAVNKYIEIA